MSHKALAYTLIALIFVATISLVYYQEVVKQTQLPVDLPIHKEKEINSYQSCINAGYPVQESFPEQCRTEEGLVFVNYEACIQIITNAMNPQTQEVHEFPTPCDVPLGWEKVNE